MLERKVQRKAKIAFFAVGHATYWGQFEGLLDSLLAYHADVKKLVEENGVKCTLIKVDLSCSNCAEVIYKLVPNADILIHLLYRLFLSKL